MSAKPLHELIFFEPSTGFSIDISQCQSMGHPVWEDMTLFHRCIEDLKRLEGGEVANIDEGRMVGHYWLRNLSLAPNDQLRSDIREANERLGEFAARVLSTDEFSSFCLIGIGGSALGPQLLLDALAGPAPALEPFFLDNTDPVGMLKTLARIDDLSKTLFLVVSKSGGTPETRNGLEIVWEKLTELGKNPASQLVAITQPGSSLSDRANQERWLAQFPIWDWVGGRTSIASPVGLLPAQLGGVDVQEFLRGLGFMDQLTRSEERSANPGYILASVWFSERHTGEVPKDMVVLPYRDELLLMSRYLQQLVMESLGKERNLRGQVVEEGIAVYGNKGSTDQHAYVQQLRDGLYNFFAVFIEVLRDSASWVADEKASATVSKRVDGEHTAGEYLSGFLHGTRQALSDKGRSNTLITISELTPFTFGMMIALFERAVGFYGSMAEINPYHQPGVEAGKKAASAQLVLRDRVLKILTEQQMPLTALEIADRLGVDEVSAVLARLRKLEADGRITSDMAEALFSRRYSSLVS